MGLGAWDVGRVSKLIQFMPKHCDERNQLGDERNQLDGVMEDHSKLIPLLIPLIPKLIPLISKPIPLIAKLIPLIPVYGHQHRVSNYRVRLVQGIPQVKNRLIVYRRVGLTLTHLSYRKEKVQLQHHHQLKDLNIKQTVRSIHDIWGEYP